MRTRRIRFLGAVAVGLVFASAVSGCAASPEGQVKSDLGARAGVAASSLQDVMKRYSAASSAKEGVTKDGLTGVVDLMGWTPAQWSSSSLSYPTTGLYDLRLSEENVVINLVLTTTVQSGGIAPKEVSGHACIAFTGFPGSSREIEPKDIRCSKPIRDSSLDRQDFAHVVLY